MEFKNPNNQHIVGSAEPLTEEACKRLRELEDWGVDLTLTRASYNVLPQSE